MYAVTVGSAAVTHVVPHVFYNGSYPVGPLQAGQHGDFQVNVRVHLWAAAAVSGAVTAVGQWGGTAVVPASLAAGESTVELVLKAPAADIRLWWPGVGWEKRLLKAR